MVTEKATEWLSPAYDEETQKEVKAMLDNEDKTPLIDAFYRELEFGTGGLRGIMGAVTTAVSLQRSLQTSSRLTVSRFTSLRTFVLLLRFHLLSVTWVVRAV